MLEQIKRFAQKMKLQIKALYFASSDPRTPKIAKLLIIVVVAYALSPIDFIPDFIPVIGYLDDLILLPIGIYFAIKLIPQELWRNCQVQAQATILTLPKNRFFILFIILFWVAVISIVGFIFWF